MEGFPVVILSAVIGAITVSQTEPAHPIWPGSSSCSSRCPLVLSEFFHSFLCEDSLDVWQSSKYSDFKNALGYLFSIRYLVVLSLTLFMRGWIS